MEAEAGVGVFEPSESFAWSCRFPFAEWTSRIKSFTMCRLNLLPIFTSCFLRFQSAMVWSSTEVTELSVQIINQELQFMPRALGHLSMWYAWFFLSFHLLFAAFPPGRSWQWFALLESLPGCVWNQFRAAPQGTSNSSGTLWILMLFVSRLFCHWNSSLIPDLVGNC